MQSKLDRPRVPRSFMRDFEIFLSDVEDTEQGKREIEEWVRHALTTNIRDDVMRWIKENAAMIKERNCGAKGITERIKKSIRANAANAEGDQ